MKQECRKCCVDKELTEFHKSKRGKNGRKYLCKSCHKKYYGDKSTEKKRKAHVVRTVNCKRCNKEFKDSHRSYCTDACLKEAKRERKKSWPSMKHEHSKKRIAEWSATYWKKIKSNEDKMERRRVYAKHYMRKRRQDPKVRITKRVSTMIRHSLKGGKAKTRTWDILRYTAEDLKQHLEQQFTDGMSWDRLLKGEIHIDHIIPQSYFKFDSYDDEQFHKCWDLNNLQPLWASDNVKKHNKLLHTVTRPSDNRHEQTRKQQNK